MSNDMFPETLTENLIDTVIKQAASLTPEERVELFLHYTTKAQCVWLAKGSEGFLMIEDNDTVLLPVWPHKDLIQTWEVAGETQVTPESVPLSTFIDTWLVGMAENQTGVCVSPLSAEDAGISMSAQELAQSLREEAH